MQSNSTAPITPEKPSQQNDVSTPVDRTPKGKHGQHPLSTPQRSKLAKANTGTMSGRLSAWGDDFQSKTGVTDEELIPRLHEGLTEINLQ